MFVLLDVNERLAWICPSHGSLKSGLEKNVSRVDHLFLPRIESIEDTVKPPDLNIDHAPIEQKIPTLNNVRQRRRITIKTPFSA